MQRTSAKERCLTDRMLFLASQVREAGMDGEEAKRMLQKAEEEASQARKRLEEAEESKGAMERKVEEMRNRGERAGEEVDEDCVVSPHARLL